MDHRQNVYYWKCDRPSIVNLKAFKPRPRKSLLKELTELVSSYLEVDEVALKPGVGQGNHLTFTCEHNGQGYFIRVEAGPEGDSFMDIETAIISKVDGQGVPVPKVFAGDASRQKVDFAWQILEKVSGNDLASLAKTVPLDKLKFALSIGREVAKWQQVEVSQFGPFSIRAWREKGELQGLHSKYPDYFFTQLPRHLNILRDKDLLDSSEITEIQRLFKKHMYLLDLEEPCLVHKDLAFWNILGDSSGIKAFIDWEDAVGGDPMDDFSLLGCFHSGEFISEALKGYSSVRRLPDNFTARFWMHLLRNIIMKAVIRVISGFFDKRDDFFLIAKGSSGNDLKEFTRQRILTAIEGLASESDISSLE